jgi:hypothetical protein
MCAALKTSHGNGRDSESREAILLSVMRCCFEVRILVQDLGCHCRVVAHFAHCADRLLLSMNIANPY